MLPGSAQLSALASDLAKASPDAILVWGRPDDMRYNALIDRLALEYPRNSMETILDPALGKVGVVLFPAK